jgi:hypothetical protein
LNSPPIGGGRLVPSGVVTTLTACPAAKNEYCPPGIDAISHFPQVPLLYQLAEPKQRWFTERHQARVARIFLRVMFLLYELYIGGESLIITMIYRCSSMTQFVEINLHQNLSRLPINWSIPP